MPCTFICIKLIVFVKLFLFIMISDSWILIGMESMDPDRNGVHGSGWGSTALVGEDNMLRNPKPSNFLDLPIVFSRFY